MIMCMKISTNSLCWRIAVSISVALMIINNMVFTILLRQRNAYSAFTQRHELGHGLFHLGDEYNYSTVPVDEWNYTTSLNMTATKDPTKVKWKQLLGFRNTYTCPHLDYYPYTYNSSRDCLMRETFQNDFCDVCKLQGIKVMSQLITNPLRFMWLFLR